MLNFILLRMMAGFGPLTAFEIELGPLRGEHFTAAGTCYQHELYRIRGARVRMMIDRIEQPLDLFIVEPAGSLFLVIARNAPAWIIGRHPFLIANEKSRLSTARTRLAW